MEYSWNIAGAYFNTRDTFKNIKSRKIVMLHMSVELISIELFFTVYIYIGCREIDGMSLMDVVVYILTCYFDFFTF